ncbi:MAG: hypothetical protein M3250_04935 [Thermoproteota archaeon]|jgi:hypothetical protein|nr:hypothetical protein [Thermoproteota archaeon]
MVVSLSSSGTAQALVELFLHYCPLLSLLLASLAIGRDRIGIKLMHLGRVTPAILLLSSSSSIATAGKE